MFLKINRRTPHLRNYFSWSKYTSKPPSIPTTGIDSSVFEKSNKPRSTENLFDYITKSDVPKSKPEQQSSTEASDIDPDSKIAPISTSTSEAVDNAKASEGYVYTYSEDAAKKPFVPATPIVASDAAIDARRQSILSSKWKKAPGPVLTVSTTSGASFDFSAMEKRSPAKPAPTFTHLIAAATALSAEDQSAPLQRPKESLSLKSSQSEESTTAEKTYVQYIKECLKNNSASSSKSNQAPVPTPSTVKYGPKPTTSRAQQPSQQPPPKVPVVGNAKSFAFDAPDASTSKRILPGVFSSDQVLRAAKEAASNAPAVAPEASHQPAPSRTAPVEKSSTGTTVKKWRKASSPVASRSNAFDFSALATSTAGVSTPSVSSGVIAAAAKDKQAMVKGFQSVSGGAKRWNKRPAARETVAANPFATAADASVKPYEAYAQAYLETSVATAPQGATKGEGDAETGLPSDVKKRILQTRWKKVPSNAAPTAVSTVNQWRKQNEPETPVAPVESPFAFDYSKDQPAEAPPSLSSLIITAAAKESALGAPSPPVEQAEDTPAPAVNGFHDSSPPVRKWRKALSDSNEDVVNPFQVPLEENHSELVEFKASATEMVSEVVKEDVRMYAGGSHKDGFKASDSFDRLDHPPRLTRAAFKSVRDTVKAATTGVVPQVKLVDPVKKPMPTPAPFTFSHEMAFNDVDINSKLLQRGGLRSSKSVSSLRSLAGDAAAPDNSSILGKYLQPPQAPADSTKKSFQSAFKFNVNIDSESSTIGADVNDIFAKNVQTRSHMEELSSGILGGVDDDLDVDEMTEGERRHLQYQQRLAAQKKAFNAKLPPQDIVVRYVKKPSPGEAVEAPPKMTAVEARLKFAAELSSKFKESQSREKDIRDIQQANSASNASSRRGTIIKEISIPAIGLSPRELASKCSLKLAEVQTKLAEIGEEIDNDMLHSEEYLLDADVVELLALELGLEVKREQAKKDAAESSRPSNAEGHSLVARNPIVCVMGHVDHGKTTLLDSLRKASVAASEAGGITQKLSAFGVDVKGRQVVFLDTPGHAAFTAMRSHGAAATDIVVLVVAADDGVRPQTKEAIMIAKEANCTIIVALNKMDKIPVGKAREEARLRVLTELLELDLVAESFGGDVQVVEVSGKTGEGLDFLVESLLLQADVLDLKASAEGHAECTVLEASMEKGRGVVCDMLVSWGQLNVGDNVVVGTAYGKVKAMTNDKGKSIKAAGPSTAVRLLGLRTVPSAGQELISVASEAKARHIAERRGKVLELRKAKQVNSADPSVAGTDGPIEVNVLLKADGQGTLNALEQIITGLQSRTTDVAIKIMSASVGDITRTEVESASNIPNAYILGFNINLSDSVARELAKQLDVSIFRDTVIYRLEDSLKEAMVKLMPKVRSLESEGRARVLQLFTMSGNAKVVAGVNVSSGLLKTTKPGKTEYVFKIYRRGQVHAEEIAMAELKRFKDVVHEVAQGNECGISFDGITDILVDDEIECLRVEWKNKALNIIEGDSGSVASQQQKKESQKKN